MRLFDSPDSVFPDSDRGDSQTAVQKILYDNVKAFYGL